jgi:hypothetical protein
MHGNSRDARMLEQHLPFGALAADFESYPSPDSCLRLLSAPRKSSVPFISTLLGSGLVRRSAAPR